VVKQRGNDMTNRRSPVKR